MNPKIMRLCDTISIRNEEAKHISMMIEDLLEEIKIEYEKLEAYKNERN